jgi:hypothetical protein
LVIIIFIGLVLRLDDKIIYAYRTIPPFPGNSGLGKRDPFLEFSGTYDKGDMTVGILVLLICEDDFFHCLLSISRSPVEGTPRTVCRFIGYVPWHGSIEEYTSLTLF